MRLLNRPKVIGTSIHRCGWPYVIKHIQQLDTGDGILFNDFMEQSFTCSAHVSSVLQQPWIAMSHLPPVAVKPFCARGFTQYDSLPGSAEAIHNLRGICTMSKYLAKQLGIVCDVPIHTIKYPTDTNVTQFSINRYCRTPHLVHIGWYLKNPWLLWQIQQPRYAGNKIYVRPQNTSGEHIRSFIDPKQWGRPLYDDVTCVDRLNGEQYDELLECSVIAVEYFDVAASTLVTEAIARCTPLLARRHPSLVEYLGENYPMFFDDIRECGVLLHPANVLKTHEHLHNMDKDFLSIDNFIEQFKKWVWQYE